MSNRLVLAVVAALTCAAATAFGVLLLLDRRNPPPIVIMDPIARTEIVISIEGEVVLPGVYTLPAEARVNDAVSAAGGFTNKADTSELNLAARIEDEQQIVVPAREAARSDASPVSAPGSPRAARVEDARIDVNSATARELEALPGVGPAIAARIVEHRDEHGAFARIEDIAAVEGISMAMVEEWRELITAGP
jgi:competence protein ComEA